MNINQDLVKKIQDGTHAIENDGTLEQLQIVMNICFPSVVVPAIGAFKYYYAFVIMPDTNWDMTDNIDLPTIPVTAFFSEPDKMVKVSDVVKWVDENVFTCYDGDRHIEYEEIINYLNELP